MEKETGECAYGAVAGDGGRQRGVSCLTILILFVMAGFRPNGEGMSCLYKYEAPKMCHVVLGVQVKKLLFV